jgi:prepilin-type N-terminal cleavage/methylation domain-containing protein
LFSQKVTLKSIWVVFFRREFMNNNIKAFTIVELAVVLVVIGIILAMAVKGKQLVEAAQIKADIKKIENIRTAMYIYYAKTGRYPDNRPDAHAQQYKVLDKTQLYETVKASDFFLPHISDGAEIILEWCSRGTYGQIPVSPKEDRFTNDFNMTDGVCAHWYISKVGVCSLESILDDSFLNSGDGMAWNVVSDAEIDTVDMQNCYSNSGMLGDQRTGSYAFKLL